MKKVNLVKYITCSLIVSSTLYANQNVTLDEVMVSANKVEESISDVPQSITVITNEELEEKGIKKVFDVVKEVPNMNIRGNTGMGTNLSFRGLNSSMFTNNNPVVIYVDGVPYYDRYDFDPSLVNVEQIEILRGPQGTLYGKDAIGAVINIITKTPENEWRGAIGAEYGNYNYMRTTLNASGALIKDKLFAGINGSFKSDDGWITNHHEGMNKNANKKQDRKTSGFFLYKASDEFLTKLTLTDNYKKNYFIDGFGSDPSLDINSLKRKTAKNVNFDVPTFEKTKVKSQAINLSYEVEKFKIDSTTTHKKFDLDGQYDTDNQANNTNDGLKQFNYTNTDTWTQEIKLTSKNQDIKWISGVYFDKEKREQGPYGAEQLYMGAIYVGDAYSTSNSKTQAIFGQTMIPLGEKFELTLGARYQKIKKEIDAIAKSSWGGVSNSDINYNDEKTWNSFLPKVAISYKVNDNLKTFASITKGYMPGGFNYYPSNSSSEDNTFEPQESINYEIGMKYLGENYSINASIFRMNIEDIHVYKQLSGSTIFQTSNAKKAHSQGIEVDGRYYLTNNIELSGAVGFIQAKYDDYDNGTKKFDGNKIEYTPNYTASLGIAYIQEKGLYGRLDIYSRGETTFIDGANSDRMIESNGGITSNIKVGYKVGDWDIYSYITNITNEDYVNSYMSKSGGSWVGFNEPRRFGVGAIYKF
ncbi:TonB-dependent receptor [Arcobacter sp. F2176]|uniref:TonB-dependent receptor n=1 Tax=Arcobacter sp. F2176 TaxID=2044511 RepID=UPI00100B44FC|nr:TonB-dependent receptor [Arcobacter sp. F2176]RXJ81340.1 TonB-dependent siderophore receptor [Arcobacter sp. F2176]